MSTRTPVYIQTVAPLATVPKAMEELRDGIAQAIVEIPKPEMDAAFADYNEAGGWQEPEAAYQLDHLTEAVADEIAPKVAELIDEALARRLPWQWPS